MKQIQPERLVDRMLSGDTAFQSRRTERARHETKAHLECCWSGRGRTSTGEVTREHHTQASARSADLHTGFTAVPHLHDRELRCSKCALGTRIRLLKSSPQHTRTWNYLHCDSQSVSQSPCRQPSRHTPSLPYAAPRATSTRRAAVHGARTRGVHGGCVGAQRGLVAVVVMECAAAHVTVPPPMSLRRRPCHCAAAHVTVPPPMSLRRRPCLLCNIRGLRAGFVRLCPELESAATNPRARERWSITRLPAGLSLWTAR